MTIGAIEILTGPNNKYGIAIKNGFDLALDEVDKAGGVLGGRPLAISYEDSAGDKDQAINAARQLIGAKKVPLILGPTLSNEMFAVGPIAVERKIPIVGTSTTANGITAIGPYVFRTSLPETDVVPVTLRTAKEKLGIKKVAVMYGNDDAFTKSAYDVMKDALQKLGIETLTTETFGGKDTDFSAQLTKIKSLIPMPSSSRRWSKRGPGSCSKRRRSASRRRCVSSAATASIRRRCRPSPATRPTARWSAAPGSSTSRRCRQHQVRRRLSRQVQG